LIQKKQGWRSASQHPAKVQPFVRAPLLPGASLLPGDFPVKSHTFSHPAAGSQPDIFG